MKRGKEPKTYVFRTIADLKELPDDLIRPALTDLMLWLKTPHMVARETKGAYRVTLPDEFGWVNDGKHHVQISVTVKCKDEAL